MIGYGGDEHSPNHPKNVQISEAKGMRKKQKVKKKK